MVSKGGPGTNLHRYEGTVSLYLIFFPVEFTEYCLFTSRDPGAKARGPLSKSPFLSSALRLLPFLPKLHFPSQQAYIDLKPHYFLKLFSSPVPLLGFNISYDNQNWTQNGTNVLYVILNFLHYFSFNPPSILLAF